MIIFSLGDRVWYDSNANGIQDAGEIGLSEITVRLYSAAGVFIKETITDSNGNYVFENVCTNSYKIQFVAPTNYFFSKSNATSDDLDSDANLYGYTDVINVTSCKASNLTIDAGLYSRSVLATLGDYVWFDKNADGKQDVNEEGVAGVEVNLYDDKGAFVKTTKTGTEGKYSFVDLLPGNYKVQFVPSNTYTFTSKDTTTEGKDSDVNSNGYTDVFTLGIGENNPNIDAGLLARAAVGDFVWHDKNYDGKQDAGEEGIENVTAVLWTVPFVGSGEKIGEKLTDKNGQYFFTNLLPGNYRVQFLAPTGNNFSPRNATIDTLDSDVDPKTGYTHVFTLGTDTINRTVDAGMYCGEPANAILGDKVWLDANADGVQNVGETGLGGVRVDLYNTTSGTSIAQTYTDSTGAYQFSKLKAGTYKVQFVAPTGYSFSKADSAVDTEDSDANVTTGMTGEYTLVAGQSNLTVDAGLYKLATLGDYVWLDTNEDGKQDANENGLGDVTVKLFDHLNQYVTEKKTSAGGMYQFDNLIPGNYKVQFIAPKDYVFSTANTTTDTLDSDADVNGYTQHYTLTSGKNEQTVDAGLYKPKTARLGDFVWHDENANGVQDTNEAGIGSVPVYLYGADGSSQTTQTGANGQYEFINLAEGLYTVRFIKPAGYDYSPANMGGDDKKDSDADNTGYTTAYPLAVGEVNHTVDAGLYKLTSLGDFVWHDKNKDGQQDAGEAGLGGVTVNLLDGAGAHLKHTTTSQTGRYEFINLKPGSYKVQFIAPLNYQFTKQDQGADTADSDVDINGNTIAYTLVSGTPNHTIDAGLHEIETAKLGDFVWLDSNANGQQDSGELGIKGVTVKLYDKDGLSLKETQTDDKGFYEFIDLKKGDYQVQFVKPVGYALTAPNQINDLIDSDADVNTGYTSHYTLAPVVAPVVAIDDLSLEFPTYRGVIPALAGVTIAVRPGEIVGLVGESGSGKSVTAMSVIRLLPEGAMRVTAGEIRLLGRDVLAAREPALEDMRGRLASMIFQEPMNALNPTIPIGRQIVQVIRRHEKVSEAEATSRAERLLTEMQVQDAARVMRLYPFELSGGMRQRVLIAMAFACNPKLLIADEPTTALDVTVQAQVLALLRDKARARGAAVLFITHDLAVVAQLCDRAYVMYAGRIIEQGATDAVLRRPLHPYTRALLASLPEQARPKQTLAAIPGTAASPAERPEGCAFRPRCGFAHERCAVLPPLAAMPGAAAHQAACWLVEEGRADTVVVAPAAAAAAAAPAGAPLLRIEALSVRFPAGVTWLGRPRGFVHALNGVDLAVGRGETLGIVGESGCGKTTLGQVVMRLIRPTAGTVRFDGEDIWALTGEALARLRRRFQIVFQDPQSSLDPRMPAGRIITEPLAVSGNPGGLRLDQRAAMLADQVGLRPDQLGRYPHEFSGGQRQRIAIARALALEPDLVLLDEPTSALDVSVQAQILNLLAELQRRLALTYLFISHNVAVIRHIADRVAVMYLGQVVELGPAEAVLERPAHPYTRALMAAVPKLERTAAPGAPLRDTELPSNRVLPTGCYFRDRCPFAAAGCERPQILAALAGDPAGRQVRCHRAAELSDQARNGSSTRGQ